MAMSRETIIPAVLIAGAILAHAFITQPPRYQFLLRNIHQVIRADAQSGEAIVCGLDDRPDGSEFFDCSPPQVTPPK